MKQSKVESRQATNSPDLGFWITPHRSPEASSTPLSSSFLLASASSAFRFRLRLLGLLPRSAFFLDSVFAPAGVLGAKDNPVPRPTAARPPPTPTTPSPSRTGPDTTATAFHPSDLSAMAGSGGSSEVWGEEVVPGSRHRSSGDQGTERDGERGRDAEDGTGTR
jgi:hypothetical protein